ncbi:unnamed protein product [Rhizoctonia solani]|uniref:CHAT domain-containing protein n=1 Tax=Rhizoctonia solani TaxID=456999 RepID=A0A8H2WER3_9AGAM|nr:unnamed protein product [Rhizoctonia solani]
MQRELDEIDNEVESIAVAMSLAPDGHPGLPLLLARLGAAHNDRYALQGDPDDILKVIEYMSSAIALTPEDDPDLPDLLVALAIAHGRRFQRLGEEEDIKNAIDHASLALALTPDDHPDLARRLANLTIAHRVRFEGSGELDDIEKAIEYSSRALSVTPEGHPELPEYLGDLGTSYGYRFDRVGELGDLDKAIEYQSQGLVLIPDDHPRLPIILNNLALSHKNRFNRLGELHDLEKAIKHGSRALACTPKGHPDLSLILSNQAGSHWDRYKRLGELNDIEKSIKYDSLALTFAPERHPNLPIWQLNLGLSYSERYQHLDDPDDLSKAIEYKSRAVALTPEGHPRLPFILTNTALSYRSRFQQLGKIDDIMKAIDYSSRAISLTPSDDHLLSFHHVNRALSCVDYYEHTGEVSHLQDALDSFRVACHSSAWVPRERFLYARRWARLASEHEALDCIEAYQTTIDLLPQFIWLGATTDQRYQDLAISRTLAIDAASAAISSSNYSLALEWLEHARCVVWNQSLMLRSPLDELESSHPTIAARLQTLANQLQNASTESQDLRELRALSSGAKTAEQVAREHRRLAQEYNDILSKARALPGFEDFLRPIKVNRLVHAARNGPVVVLSYNEDHRHALVVIPGNDKISHILLPKSAPESEALMKKSFRIMQFGRREVGRRPLEEVEEKSEFGAILAVLWYDIVKPVLDFLGYTNDVLKGDLPHITWCPTGALSFLPLHAAGDYDLPQSRVFDYAISSYTPTLTAILDSTPSSFSCPRVVAIGQEATPGHSSLPGTTRELEYLKAHTQNKGEYLQLTNDQATTSTVLDAMEHYDWVHLACHAHQNVGEATQSGFFLFDGVLDLASINRRSFKNKGLAFLSACQTATGDKELPDEAVHLASGMLMAGYTSVIATMWSVADSDAPLVADKVYSQLMKYGRLGNGEAGRVLHNAVAELRERVGEQEFERWVPYIHIGS